MGQIALDFTHDPDYARDNFFVSSSNQEAFDYISAWPQWQTHFLFLYGEHKCGKTHLANIWQNMSQAQFLNSKELVVEGVDGSKAYIIENISELKDENALFHIYNVIQQSGGFLLVTDKNSPAQNTIKLADLRSRLSAMTSIAIGAPDDELLRMFLLKNFSDRQLSISIEAIDYIIARVERSFSAVQMLVEKIDNKSLEEKRNITIPLIRDIL